MYIVITALPVNTRTYGYFTVALVITKQQFKSMVLAMPTRASSGSRSAAWYSFLDFHINAYIKILPLKFSFMNLGDRYKGIDDPTLILANVALVSESWLHQGYFTAFREYLEDVTDVADRVFVVEDIMNPVLLASLGCHGYSPVISTVHYDSTTIVYPTLARMYKQSK